MFIPYEKLKSREIPAHVSTSHIRDIFKRICKWDDVDAPGRDIWITPLYGAHERPAGFSIVINGSPSRGQLFVLGPTEYHVYYNAEQKGGGLSRCRPKDARDVLSFLNSCGFGFDCQFDLSPAVSRWTANTPTKENPRR